MTRMKRFESQRMWYVALNIGICVLFVVCAFWVRPHFEENFSYWKLWEYESAGYTKGFHHLNDVVLWQDLLTFLHVHFPAWPWFPTLVLSCCFVSVSVIANLLFYVARRNNFPLPLAFALVLAIIIPLLPNWFWVHQNRVGFLMAGTALLAGMVLEKENFVKAKIGLRIGLLAWFVGGLFFRAEAALAISIILLPGYVAYCRFTKKAILGAGLWYALPIGVFFATFFLKTVYSSQFYYATEPDVEYEIMDRRNIVPLSDMKTREDSAKYNAVAMNWMLADVEKSTPAFIRSLINKPNDFWHRYFFFLYPSTGSTTNVGNTSAWKGLLSANPAALLLISGFILLTAFWRGWKQALILLFYFAFSTFVLSFSFSVHGYQRVLEPVMGLILCMGSFLLVGGAPLTLSLDKKVLGWVLLGVVVWQLQDVLRDANARSRELAVGELERKHTVNAVMANPQRKYVAVALDHLAFDTGDAFELFDGFGGKVIILPEFAQFAANDEFLEQTTRITGCRGTDFLCRIRFIKEHASQTIFIATKERLAFYDYYMEAMYGYETHFSSAEHKLLEGDVYFWFL